MYVPLTMIEGAEDARPLPRFMRHPLFWIGFGAAAFKIAWNIPGYWHAQWPMIPNIRLRIPRGRIFPGISSNHTRTPASDVVTFPSPCLLTARGPMQRARAWSEEELIDRLAAWIVRQGLVTPAVFLLEAGKPFSFLGSQALWMLQPLLGPAVGHERIAAYARLLEDRTGVERLLARLAVEPARRGGVSGGDDAG